MKNTVMFDLGSTLLKVHERFAFPDISDDQETLERAINEVQKFLSRQGLLRISSGAIWPKVKMEMYESKDHRVRPLEERLVRIFQLDDLSKPISFTMDMCRCFVKPIFALHRVFEDTFPTLHELKIRGLKTAIVSNIPWGSPSDLWRNQIRQLGLIEAVDTVVFCRDVGWRKPAKQIFEFALNKLQTSPQQCIFVGDEPECDLLGPRAVGIEAVLIDRTGKFQYSGEKPIRNLSELLDRL